MRTSLTICLFAFLLEVSFIGCSSGNSQSARDAKDNQNEMSELRESIKTLQLQLNNLSTTLVKTQQAQNEIIRWKSTKDTDNEGVLQDQINSRVNEIEKRLEASINLLTTTSEDVQKIKENQQHSHTQATVTPKEKQDRTQKFLLDAVERGLKNAIKSGSLSDEDRIHLLQLTEYLNKSILNGKDPRLTERMMLFNDSKSNQILTRWFPEFLPE